MVEWLSDIDNPDEACSENITDDAKDSQSHFDKPRMSSLLSSKLLKDERDVSESLSYLEKVPSTVTVAPSSILKFGGHFHFKVLEHFFDSSSSFGSLVYSQGQFSKLYFWNELFIW